jgi:hypothetical protein
MAAKSTFRVGADTSEFSAKMNALRMQAREVGRELARAGINLTGMASAATAVGAAMRVVGSSVRQYFEDLQRANGELRKQVDLSRGVARNLGFGPQLDEAAAMTARSLAQEFGVSQDASLASAGRLAAASPTLTPTNLAAGQRLAARASVGGFGDTAAIEQAFAVLVEFGVPPELAADLAVGLAQSARGNASDAVNALRALMAAGIPPDTAVAMAIAATATRQQRVINQVARQFAASGGRGGTAALQRMVTGLSPQMAASMAGIDTAAFSGSADRLLTDLSPAGRLRMQEQQAAQALELRRQDIAGSEDERRRRIQQDLVQAELENYLARPAAQALAFGATTPGVRTAAEVLTSLVPGGAVLPVVIRSVAPGASTFNPDGNGQ